MAKKKASKAKKKSTTAKKKMVAKVSKKSNKKSAVKSKTAKKKSAKKSKEKKVSALPKGYNNVTSYLIVNGAARAIEFYKKVFGAKEMLRMQQPDGKIMHAELKIGDSKIMLADECPDMGAHSPDACGGTPVIIHLYVNNVDATIEKAVAAGAKLMRPIEDMFYGDRSGAIEDPYGHKWSVATHVEDVTPAETRKRAAALFGN